MKDILIKGSSIDNAISFLGVEISTVAQEGCSIHNYLNIQGKALFSKLLCAGLLLGEDASDKEDTVIIEALLNDEQSSIVINANCRGEVKGYPNLQDNHPLVVEIDSSPYELTEPHQSNRQIREFLRKMLIDGVLTVISNYDNKPPESNSIKMITGEVARDITWFLNNIGMASSVGLSVSLQDKHNIKKAYGFIIKLLPDTPEETISTLENNLLQLPELLDLMDMGLSIEEIFEKFLLKGIDYIIQDRIEPRYLCNCSEEQLLDRVINSNQQEVMAICAEQETVTLHCSYCNKEYQLDSKSLMNYIVYQ